MAMLVCASKPIVGVDVAKDELVIYHAERDLQEAIPNTKTAIKKWLKALPAKVAIAIEATNVYHLLFADMAHESGCVVYMVGGYELSHYRKGVNVRAKTDALDARLLARYLKNEAEELHPWTPPSPLYRQLLRLAAIQRHIVVTFGACRLYQQPDIAAYDFISEGFVSAGCLADRRGYQEEHTHDGLDISLCFHDLYMHLSVAGRRGSDPVFIHLSPARPAVDGSA